MFWGIGEGSAMETVRPPLAATSKVPPPTIMPWTKLAPLKPSSRARISKRPDATAAGLGKSLVVSWLDVTSRRVSSVSGAPDVSGQ